MNIKQLGMNAALRWGAMSRVQKMGMVVLPFTPVVLMAHSCEVVDGNDMTERDGEHVDWNVFQWETNPLQSICFSWVSSQIRAYGPEYINDPCWPSNIVWWEEIWWHNYGYPGHPDWQREYLGWFSRECKVYDKESGFGEPLGGPCYTINGVVAA